MLSKIKEKVKLLCQIDTNYKIHYSETHKYKSKRLTKAELIEFEAQLGIQLPSEYRQYLLEVGYGMGPLSGFCSPQEIIEEYFEEEAQLQTVRNIFGTSPVNPFPFNEEDAYGCFEELSTKPIWDVACPEGLYPENGAISIVDRNDGNPVCLVISGQLAGTIWDVHQAAVGYGEWSPARKPPTVGKNLIKDVEKPLQTFYEWYDSWLSSAIRDVKTLY